MLKTEIILPLSCLCWFVALVLGTTAPANAVVATGSCSDGFVSMAAAGVASSAGGRTGFASAAVEPGAACQNVTGSCDGSPCTSITCTSTSSDGTATSESYTVNPPMSNAGCAGTFCQKKCQ
jgi:hypothetical protein